MKNQGDMICEKCGNPTKDHLCPEAVGVAAPKAPKPSSVSSGELVRRMRAGIADARSVIERGVEIMTDEQVGKWAGVRTWLEGVESDG